MIRFRSASRARLLLVCPLLAGLAGCGPAVVAQPNQHRADAPVAALEKVIADRPQRKRLELVSVQPARLEPIESTPLHSKLAAYVDKVLVDIGDAVQPKQPLVLLDTPELAAERGQKLALVDQAQAEQQQAVAQARSAEAGRKTAEAQVSLAKAAVARTDADVARWQSELARVQELVAGGAVNRQLADEAKQKLAAALAARSEAEAAIAVAAAAVVQADAAVDKAQADVAAAAARVRVAQANVAQVEALLAFQQLTAPFGGVVTQRRVDPGHFVQPGGASGPLLVLSRTDVVRVFVAVPEMEVGQLAGPVAATVHVQALGNEPISAKVERTSWSLDPASRSLQAVIDLPNPQGKLRPGMYATARLLLAERPGALVLPAAAVVRQEREAFCCRVMDGKIVRTPIQLGIKAGDEWEITGGLTGDELIALSKAATLQDGQAVDARK